jgi:hypothetical protein
MMAETNYVCRTMRKALFFGCIISTIIITVFSGPGCANIIPPEGGARDTIPPRLLKADPPDSTANFRAKRIVLTFNENLSDLKDIQNNLLFTPTFRNNPVIQVRAKTITIPFKDSLEPNTTYVLNFGNAISDFNEGNLLRNFVYTFSTGPVLDSLEIRGHVILAETGGIDSTMIVMLHKNFTDSAVVRDRPQYVARLDRNGSFRFKNLPADSFAIYALGSPASNGRRYQNKKDLFAFVNRPVIAGKADSVILYAYREISADQAPLPPPVKANANDRRLLYTPSGQGQQDLLGDFSLNFTVPLRRFDSSRLQLTSDSSFVPVNYTVQLDTTKKELRFRTEWKENTRYNLVLQKDFATDTTGKQLLRTDTLFFMTKKLADYGNLTLRLRNLDLARNPVIEFVQGNQVMFSAPLTSAVFTKKLFLPGDYELRILYDANGNGKWDPGQFFKAKRQPELVHPIPEKITVKPDWDNEYDRSL